MDGHRPLISVCIPAFNRSVLLTPLLDSILSQAPSSCEVLICEDMSPERRRIRGIAAAYAGREIPVHYYENERTLGYDGNLRRLVTKARGRYCLFMGNDDILAPGALGAVAGLLARHPDAGVILRSYASFREDPAKPDQLFRYFPEETCFPAGQDTAALFFRRCVVISGLVIRRDDAESLATDRFDGTLLYQLYLAGRVLMRAGGVSTPELIALYRTGGVPDFGHSAREAGRFVPGHQTPESSLVFMKGMLEIAAAVDVEEGSRIRPLVLQDLSAYSLPVLSIQAGLPRRQFVAYAAALRRLGLSASPLFYFYFMALLLLGKGGTDALVVVIKRLIGRTPALGAVARSA